MVKEPKRGVLGTEMHEHPSYGMIGISRTSGTSRRLFGSSLDGHYTTFRLRIVPGEWTHDLHEDRYYGRHLPLIEVELSATQFLEAITAMNHGSGVPCTIRSFDGKQVEEPPAIQTEVERIKAGFGDALKDKLVEMKARRKDIEKATEKLPVKAKEQIRVALDVMIAQLGSNMKFYMDQFDEAVVRREVAAKHEVETFASHVLQAAGLAALADRPELIREVAQQQLTDGKDKDDGES